MVEKIVGFSWEKKKVNTKNIQKSMSYGLLNIGGIYFMFVLS